MLLLQEKNGKGNWKIHRGHFCVLKDGSEVLVYAVALASHPRLERFIVAWNNDDQLQAVPVKDVCSCSILVVSAVARVFTV